MSVLHLSALGLVQGLTEFLPVSSSGHLLIVGEVFGRIPSLAESIYLHAGTLASTVYYFRRELGTYFNAFSFANLGPALAGRLPADAKKNIIEAGLVMLANIPTGIIGFAAKRYLSSYLNTPVIAAYGLLATGAFLYYSDRLSGRNAEFSPARALAIGCAQGFAVLPGISRSGLTVVAALLSGLGRKDAFRFSFLISLPAIAGATVLEILEEGSSSTGPFEIFPGIFLAFVSGLLAIMLLEKMVIRARLKVFSFYIWAAALLFIVFRGGLK